MQPDQKLIGVAGTNGAGKDAVGHLLSEHYNFLFITVTDLLREECRKRGLPIERENLRMVSAEWRREHGTGVLVDKAVEAFRSLPDNDRYTGLVIASLRNPGENDRVHELEGQILWVDAKPEVRYDRIQKNAASRGRAAEDTKTFEQFMAEEEAEMHPPEGADSAMLNMAAVKENSDLFVENNSSNLRTFEMQMATVLGLPLRNEE
jgi:dephospho-CoA kinase